MIRSFVIENRARCKACGDSIVSKSVWNYTSCSCGKIAVDGGLEYMRRCGDLDMIYENSLMGLERHRKLIEETLLQPRFEGSGLDEIERRLPGKVWRCQGSFEAGRPEIAEDEDHGIQEIAPGHFESKAAIEQSRIPREELHRLIEQARYAARCRDERLGADAKPFSVRGSPLHGFVEIEVDDAQVMLDGAGRARVMLTPAQLAKATRGELQPGCGW